jgi:hypothetical protein
VIDVHSLRLAAVDLRLPRLLGIVMYAATVLSFLLVGVASSSDGKRDPIAQGLLTVSQTALTDLLRQMTTPVP